MEFKLWLENTHGMIVTAYHCGAKFDQFSTNFAGSGEGMNILGPGIYFTTSQEIASRYNKYVKEPIMYEVIINTSDFFPIGMLWHRNTQQSEIVSKRLEDLAKKFKFKDKYSLPFASALQHGRAPIGGFVKFLGKQKAISEFVNHGIRGAIEEISQGALEMSVFDTAVIKLVNVESF